MSKKHERYELLFLGILAAILGLAFAALGVVAVVSEDPQEREGIFYHFLAGSVLFFGGLYLMLFRPTRLKIPGGDPEATRRLRYTANPDPEVLARLEEEAFRYGMGVHQDKNKQGL